jgi:hypothetical protein
MKEKILFDNNDMQISVDNEKFILYIKIINGTYNKEKFEQAIQYYKNFWILVNNFDDKYYQIFIFNNVKVYSMEFYNTIFKTLVSLEKIFIKNLYSSYLINDSNAIHILKPLLNLYKSVRPFHIVKKLDEAYKFINTN